MRKKLLTTLPLPEPLTEERDAVKKYGESLSFFGAALKATLEEYAERVNKFIR